MPHPVFVADAFTAVPFRGNPAAVCLMDGPGDTGWMRNVAREMNLSETAFTHPMPGGAFGLRWFTPMVEVDLCGHATLAAAHILWETGRADAAEPISFHTRSGVLSARFSPFDTPSGGIELDFPSDPPTACHPPAGLGDALGAPLVWTGRGRFDHLIEVDSETTVRTLAPDMAALSRLDSRGFIVTARSDGPAFDFVSRFFAPAVGVPEDPVTGSAHCALAPYWAERLGRPVLKAHQASSRGGELRVEHAGERVRIAGQAVTVWHGELLA